MVNPGHPSTGCKSCRLRRILCDSTRPSCLRCLKSQRICLGYDDLGQDGPQQADIARRSYPCGLSTSSCSRSLDIIQSSSTFMTTESDDRGSWGLADLICLVEYMIAGNLQDERLNLSPRNVLFLSNITTGRHTSNESTGLFLSVLELTGTNFWLLHQPSPSLAVFSNASPKYYCVTQSLRDAVASCRASPALVASVFLLAVNDMVTNDSPVDRTWQTHVNGLLSLLAHIRPTSGWYCFCNAVQNVRGDNNFQDVVALLNDPFEKISLLLDISMLRLYDLCVDAERSLFIRQGAPRQLDVKKVQLAIKRLQRELRVVHPMLSNCTRDEKVEGFLAFRWNQYRTLNIIMARVLIRSNELIHSSNGYRDSKEFTILLKAVQQEVDEICSNVQSVAGYNGGSGTPSPPKSELLTALTIVWPLQCALSAPGINEQQRLWISEKLCNIGERASIPQAMSLARLRDEATSDSDIIAGLLLIAISFSPLPS
ncbi:hypothetical protein J3E69DRAFT_347013 [Trichoderma sp. SZMC 28015]